MDAPEQGTWRVVLEGVATVEGYRLHLIESSV